MLRRQTIRHLDTMTTTPAFVSFLLDCFLLFCFQNNACQTLDKRGVLFNEAHVETLKQRS